MDEGQNSILKDLFGPLEDEVEFFFSSFFGSSYPTLYRKELYWKPPTDVYESEKAFVVLMEIAQIKAEEVSITFQEGILYIRGIRKAEPPPERRRYQKMEINYGPFERRVAIPGDVDLEKLSAHYKNGFLEIRLPKINTITDEALDIEIE